MVKRSPLPPPPPPQRATTHPGTCSTHKHMHTHTNRHSATRLPSDDFMVRDSDRGDTVLRLGQHLNGFETTRPTRREYSKTKVGKASNNNLVWPYNTELAVHQQLRSVDKFNKNCARKQERRDLQSQQYESMTHKQKDMWHMSSNGWRSQTACDQILANINIQVLLQALLFNVQDRRLRITPLIMIWVDKKKKKKKNSCQASLIHSGDC